MYLPNIKLCIIVYTRNVRQTFWGLKTSHNALSIDETILPCSLGLEGGRINRWR